jgi:serine/threonine-protein kinase
MDIVSAKYNAKQGLLELAIAANSIYQCGLTAVEFEFIAESPGDSFFLLTTGGVKPSGIYEKDDGESEELLELPGGKLVKHSILDHGYYGHDERGIEKPIPRPWRSISRYFAGKFLLVCKASAWNLTPATYDARHNQMTAAQIRAMIEAAVVPTQEK